MANKAVSGKNLILDSVRVTYDETSDSVHVTAKDADFEKGDNFHLVLNKGTTTEETLRKVLNKHGIIPEDRVRSLPKFARLEERKAEGDKWSDIPLGVLRDGSELIWSTEKSAHVFVNGATGCGKSVLERIILQYTSKFPDNWDLYGVDFKNVELQPFKTSGQLKAVATDLNEASRLFSQMEDEIEIRFRQMEYEEVDHYKDLSSKPKAILIVIDEISEFSAKPEDSDFTRIEYLQKELKRKIMIDTLSKLAILGRTAGMHLAIFSQRPIDKEFRKVDVNATFRIVLGRTSKELSEELTGNEIASNTLVIHGRGVCNRSDKFEQFQSYYTPQI